MLDPDPETVHFAHVLDYELNGVIDSDIGQHILHHLEQVVPKEQTSQGLLDTFHHIEQVCQNQIHRGLVALRID